jgi:hydroxylaminobenzene mutase
VKSTELLRHRLAQAGAWLFAIGLLTGFWAAMALTDRVALRVPRLALAAHLNGLLGGLWLIAVASTLDRMRYGIAGRRRLAVAAALPAWANWLLTVIASVLGVRGLELTADTANNVVALLLQVFVVWPALGAALTWAWGFGGPRHEPGQLPH